MRPNALNKLAKTNTRSNPKNLILHLLPSNSNLNLNKSSAIKNNNDLSPLNFNSCLESPIIPPNSPLLLRLRSLNISSPNNTLETEPREEGYDSGFNSPVPMSPWATENFYSNSIENYSILNKDQLSPQINNSVITSTLNINNNSLPWQNVISTMVINNNIVPSQLNNNSINLNLLNNDTMFPKP